jgi:branched-chain amino acid transport system ATP-binding protein
MSSELALSVKDLGVSYGGIRAVKGISLEVQRGEIVTLIGSNGAGKTSTLRGIMRLAKGTGSVQVFGEEVTHLETHEVAARGVALVPEGRGVFTGMTVRENLELGCYRRARARREKNIGHVADVFPRLKERFGQKAGTLSGGEQQMLAIGRGMMAEPVLLILDEPSIGLSPLLVEEMFALIGRLRERGLTILLVEQNVMQSLEIADRAFVMENGEIRLSGKASEMLDDPELRRSYLGLA